MHRDEGKRKVLFIAPCILNPSLVACGFFTKKGFELRENFLKKLIAICSERMIGIEAYPCPEFLIQGFPRPAASKLFYEKYRRRIRRIARAFARKIRKYREMGIEVLGIICVDGSPVCGKDFTKLGKAWSREEIEKFKKSYKAGLDLSEEYYQKLEHKKRGSGVFIEELLKLIPKELHNRIIGVNYGDMDGTIRKVKEIIKS